MKAFKDWFLAVFPWRIVRVDGKIDPVTEFSKMMRQELIVDNDYRFYTTEHIADRLSHYTRTIRKALKEEDSHAIRVFAVELANHAFIAAYNYGDAYICGD